MGFLDRIAGRFDDLVAGDGDSQSRSPSREHVELGRARAADGELENAVAAFGRAVDADTTNVDAWLGLAEALALLQRFEPARDAFRRALTLPVPSERRTAAQAALGRLYARAGQTGKAIRELRKAVVGLPDDVDTVTALGRVLIGDGISAAAADRLEGSEWLARAARLPGGEPRLLLEAAAARGTVPHTTPGGAAGPDAEAAERLLREAASRAPEDAVIRAALARHLAATNQLAAARREANAATTAAPGEPAAWAALREVHAAAGDYAGALEAARQEAARGNSPPFAVWLSVALGAEDRAALEEALGHGQPHDPGLDETQRLLDGSLNDSGVMRLASLAPTPAARRFVVAAVAPPPAPADNLYALLGWAQQVAARHAALLPQAVFMARAQEAFDRPLLVAVMGEFNAGKSSFVNALAGAPVAPVGVTPTTATINILRYGAGGGRVVYHDGHARELDGPAVRRFLEALHEEDAGAIRQVEIFAPVEALRRVEIVDTPGLNSLRAAHEKVARDFLLEADAIVWVFSVGQAAKATEREALTLAHTAGKRVLGVLNKVDRATSDEVTEVVRHVENELGPLVERVVPLAARAALAGRLGQDDDAVAASGMPMVEAALESHFFARARELKRSTALLTLRRFLTDARVAIDAAGGVPQGIPDAEGAATDPSSARATLFRVEQDLRSVLAGERVALRARLDAAFRSAAVEVLEFVQPRGWLFGEHRAEPEDESFLRDLLDDGTVEATAKTRVALVAAATAADTLPDGGGSELVACIDDAIERFRAYARGIIEGAAAVFFRVDLPHIRLDSSAIHHALGRWSPDPEEALFRPIERAIAGFVARAAADLNARELTREIASLMAHEHVFGPLAALETALASLADC
ncbi:MAG: dynamin family protein [Polyangia bacterium]